MGTAPDAKMDVRCLYCLTGIVFRPMIAYKDARFVCRHCAHCRNALGQRLRFKRWLFPPGLST
jgi:hypothetical protein